MTRPTCEGGDKRTPIAQEDTQMNRKIITFALTATAVIGFANSVYAAAGETALGNCYNMVISSCNATSNHPVPCAENGMDACDEEYGNQTASTPINKFGATQRKQKVGLLLPAVQAAREAAR